MFIYLRDTAYIGKYKLYRKQEYIDNYIPRIMSDDLFNSVQRLHKKSAGNKTPKQITPLFSGLIFWSNNDFWMGIDSMFFLVISGLILFAEYINLIS